MLILIVLISISSCKKPATIEKWDAVTIDSKIKENKIYKELDKENEIPQPFKLTDTLSKRTSYVGYFTGEKIDFKDKYSEFNYCEANFLLSDTLRIKIGHESDSSASGFTINLKNNKFYTQAYLSTNVVCEDDFLPLHKIIHQKLTLNKPNYKVGDSLFGHIEFKSIETDRDKNEIQHFGKGYFRTKIKEF